MADYRAGLQLIPDHMWRSAKIWIENGEPHPLSMGQFFFSVFTNRLVEATMYADPMNKAALGAWAEFLQNYCPEQCWGSEQRMVDWYDLKHLHTPKS
jgi:hypothetical protein